MKGMFLLIFPVVLLFSCKKENSLPLVETITKGSKWGLEIGSSYVDVYRQLQALAKEKDFNEVALVYRQPFSNPQQIQPLLNFYHSVTLMNNTAVIDRVFIEFPNDTVKSISAGGALPAEISKWPQDVSDETAIHKNDLVANIYPKLLAIYQMPAYNNYKIILPDKPLKKPFDPDMANNNEWAFSMSQVVKPSIRGTSSVRLLFKNGKLDKIHHEYNEAVVFN
jgi:hypothetical protein